MGGGMPQRKDCDLVHIQSDIEPIDQHVKNALKVIPKFRRLFARV